MQLIARPHRATGPGARADRAGIGPVAAWVLGMLARAASTLVLELIDVFTPGRRAPAAGGPPAGRATPADPVRAAAVKARDAKRAAGPHLAVTMRVAVTTAPGVPEQVRRGRVAAIVGGYDLVTLPLRAHRVRRPTPALAARAPGRSFIATVGELAALWHLPADPTRHGMAAPPARDMPPPRVLPRLP